MEQLTFDHLTIVINQKFNKFIILYLFAYIYYLIGLNTSFLCSYTVNSYKLIKMNDVLYW